ncbi:MAG: hemolysin family protein [Candidatus Woesearchaeota archaeon]
MIEYIIILVILLALSAFFSGSETAFMSMGKFKFKEYLRKKKPAYTYVKVLKEDPHRLLSTILIGNNIVNIAAASIATIAGTVFFTNLGFDLTQATVAGIVTGVLTIVVLIFGEVIPKTYAHLHYEQYIQKSAKIIYVLSIVFKPFIKILDVIARFFTRGRTVPKGKEVITEEEIKTMINVGSDEGSIDTYERQLIHKIFQFDDKITKEIMTPTHKVFAVDGNLKIKSILKTMIEEGYSRIPVYEDNPANVIGIFHMKDVLDTLHKNQLEAQVKTIAVRPYFVPESKPIDKLFKEMQRKKIQMAIVVDEFGALSGVVTSEDVLEEIVGEIYDEDEQHEHIIQKTGSREYTVSGEATLREVKEHTKLKLEGLQSETISAYILERLGRIPRKEEVIKLKKGTIIIEYVTDRAIEAVKVKVKA